ncbi:pyridine nucleotide-disulfide oxidoreductase [Rhodococcus sp. ACS1]|uniref:NAD(P)/FAD-dependent oxidoreductase n=1 Tax=Rhodococcus sp. ACS1 TaxID=2028570 RepID=UPI000BB148E4|nr:FAD-dependent oxidoreductase [Rhodococcus sp. ACS1]PBC51868.1 pyridine nucleotide-disulfide oxidoreductase [Rhodococcus sp. ACS1]
MGVDGAVIVGGGHGGFTAAVALREQNYQGTITLISDDEGLPYQRPPLSKAYLAGKVEAAKLAFRPVEFYQRKAIDLINSRADQVDPTARTITLENGRSLGYEHLILATGATPRAANIPGSGLKGVYRLHSLRDAEILREKFETARKIVVIGGGYIGLEFAATATARGKDVTIIQRASRLMARSVTPLMSEYFLRQHQQWGARVLLGAQVQEIVGNAQGIVRSVRVRDNSDIEADLVVIGVGVDPNTGLAERAGLEISNGVAVDRHLRTSDRNIFAIGDCARFPTADAGVAVRRESVQNAVDQARCVAANLAGHDSIYQKVPLYWSDQQDRKLQVAGDSSDCDDIVPAGDTSGDGFTVYCFRDGTLIAVESVNRPSDHIAARRVLTADAAPLSTSITPDLITHDLDLGAHVRLFATPVLDGTG